MRLARRISEGEILPRFYGQAYLDWPTGESVCYPIPLNFLVSIERRIRIRLKWGWPSDEVYSKIIYHRGWRQGYKVGRADEKRNYPDRTEG